MMKTTWWYRGLALAMTMMASKAASSVVTVEDFANPTQSWQVMNDPVMGGESKATVEIRDNVAVFDGEVVNVPFLQAPGFVTMFSSTSGTQYPDVSSCDAFVLTVAASGEGYKGYRMSFGTVHVPGGRHAFGYKTNFDATTTTMKDIVIPFKDFTAKWDDATGDAIVACEQDEQYCPTKSSLENLQTISIWAEGVAGKIHLEVASIAATGCNNETKTSPIEESSITDDAIVIEDFSKGSSALHWMEINDPVMGGESTGSFSIQNDAGVFAGQVVDVPFLKAPGFISVQAHGVFPNVASCLALELDIMSSVPYSGYRVSFGTKAAPGSMPYIHGFKTTLTDIPVGSFDKVILPFRDFSDKWDPYTGNVITSCDDDASFCPDEDTLENFRELTIFAEGVAGDVTLSIRSIRALNCSSSRNHYSLGRGVNAETTTAKCRFVPMTLLVVAFVGVMGWLWSKQTKSTVTSDKNNYQRVESVLA